MPDSLVIVAGPIMECVSLEEAKAQARIAPDMTEEDALIALYIEAARRDVENWTGRTLMATTYEWQFDAFPAGTCPLIVPRSPLLGVDAITYVDAGGVMQAFTDYVPVVGSDPGRITLAYTAMWPTTRRQAGAITVQFRAGYAEMASDVEAPFRLAILMQTAHYYENREVIAEKQMYSMPFGVERLLWPYRTANVLIA